jgi:hypothetical protein
VRHSLYSDKKSSDIDPALCQWLIFHFSGRIQRIKMMGDCVSRDILVTQGSHLRPLWFIWFVNKISQIFEYVRVLFYAVSSCLWFLGLLENSERSEQAGRLVWSELIGAELW